MESKKDFKENGTCKSWYEDGKLRLEETYDTGRLLSGRYYGADGKFLDEIKNGSGKKIVFPEPLGEPAATIRGFAEYHDGLKNGLEILYQDYEKGLKSQESQYKDGKLHGKRTSWMPSGEKNVEGNYEDGVEQGEALCWYPNGTLQSRIQYDHDQSVASIYFYDNGQKKEEFARDETGTSTRTLWYPSGTIMARLRYGKESFGGIPTEAESFDSSGKSTGQVKEGEGFLVLADNLGERFGGGTFHLDVYERNHTSRHITLPSLGANFDYTPGSQTIRASLLVSGASDTPVGSMTVRVLLPPGCVSTNLLEFSIADLIPRDTSTLGPFFITFPKPFEQWFGDIRADVVAVIAGKTVRYEPVVLTRTETLPHPSALPARMEPPQPSDETALFRARHKESPAVGSEHFPDFQQAVSAWSLGKSFWLLYERPAVLLTSTDAGQTWTILRRDIPYRPQGLLVLARNHELLWGIHPTATPEQGIPYEVEESKDGGKSWVSFRIPQLDYLLGIGENENVFLVSGVRLPKGRLPKDRDWFELPKVNLLSKDRMAFTEIVGPSFFDIGTIETKSLAPNGLTRAFVSNVSFLDPGFSIYLAKNPDSIPVQVLFTPKKPELVWSANSKVLALRMAGKFFAYVELETGQSDKCDAVLQGARNQKEDQSLSEFDSKVRAIMSHNTP